MLLPLLFPYSNYINNPTELRYIDLFFHTNTGCVSPNFGYVYTCLT